MKELTVKETHIPLAFSDYKDLNITFQKELGQTWIIFKKYT